MTADSVDTADIEARVRDVLAAVFRLDPADVGPDSSMDTVEGWDSLQQLTVVMAVEEEFDIALADDETMTATTFPLIVAIVGDHLAA